MNQNNKTDWKLWLSVAGLVVLVLLGTLVFWAGVVRNAINDGDFLQPPLRDAVVATAEFPGKVKLALLQTLSRLSGTPINLLIDKKELQFSAENINFPTSKDDGYLLLSQLSPKTKSWMITLTKVSNGKVLAVWQPDAAALNDQLSAKKLMEKGSSADMRFMHPLLLQDASVLFNVSYYGAARVSYCSNKPQWVLDHTAHHANELDVDGNGFWTSSRNEQYLKFNPQILPKVADDSLLHVSLDGRVLENLSFTEILEQNGLGTMLFGTAGNRAQPDPLHINQISVAQSNSNYWKRGDLLVSSRHLSTLFLYRPATGKIIWYKQGPWMNQHSAKFVDDHRISVFDDHVYDLSGYKPIFLRPGDVNRVFVYDFASNTLAQPWERLLQQANVKTLTEGRARVLPDGGLFVEETNNGRLLRFGKNELMWQWVNNYDKDNLGALGWSRYLTLGEVKPVLDYLNTHPCTAQ